jgi:hypothetical protein
MMSNATTFFRDFATNKTLDHGFGPSITFTRTSTATYFDSSGTLTTATANTPRFDHDPSTLESKGLLIEEGRTNSIQNSQGTGAVAGTAGTQPTSWGLATSTTGLTRTISTGTISGFNYIDVAFSGTTTGSISSLTFDPQPTTAGYTASSGQTWTGSVYLALVSGSLPPTTPNVLITERDSSNTLLVQTATSFSSATSSLQRFTATRTLNNASTAKITLDIRISSIPTSTAVNFTLRISAPQLELGAFATSYIPTTSVAVSRGADSAVVTPISSFYNASEGTIYNEFSVFALDGATTLRGISQFAESSTTLNRLQTGVRGTGQYSFQVVSANSTEVQIDTVAGAITVGAIAKTSQSYKSNDNARSINGATATTNTSSITQPTRERFRFGDNGTAILNGHIRKIAYWPRRLTNANLQAMTA